MEKSRAAEVIAMCRRGISGTFHQKDVEIYCLPCVDELKNLGKIERPGEGTGCGGEYQWVTKVDMQSKSVTCTRCGELITVEPRLKIAKP